MGSETKQPNEALRRQRLLRGWSQQKVADQLGTSEEMVNRWERGKRKTSPFYQEKLCILFGKSAEELGFLPLVSVLTDEVVPTVNEQLFDTEQVTDNKTLFHPEILSVGGLMVNAIILARGHYGPKEIYCFYDDAPIQLTPDIEALKKDLLYELEKRKSNGETTLPYNSGMYKLRDFNVGYREVINVEKVPVLRLKFDPTDYFTQMVTDLNVSHPVRERYANAASITEHPVPEFASILAINLNLITKDGYLRDIQKINPPIHKRVPASRGSLSA
jgi:transcriptional regulator with XRE-family HTH domain